MNKLLIIDSHSLAYRCYYALKNSPTGLITDAEGTPITITSGFLRSLSILISQHQPTHLVCCFDPGGQTWRHDLYPQYKGTRKKDPEEQEQIYIDLRNLQAVLREKAIAVVKIPNYEADDAIAAICNSVRGKWEEEAIAGDNEDYIVPALQIVICSSDKDLLQLVDDEQNISLYCQQGKISKTYTEKEVFEEYGVRAHQIADYKALVGDKSDNIPGVTGVGKISATHLLNKWDDVTAIIGCLDKIKPQFAKKIEPEKDKLRLWYKLTKLENNIKGSIFSLEEFKNTDLNRESAIALELGVK